MCTSHGLARDRGCCRGAEIPVSVLFAGLQGIVRELPKKSKAEPVLIRSCSCSHANSPRKRAPSRLASSSSHLTGNVVRWFGHLRACRGIAAGNSKEVLTGACLLQLRRGARLQRLEITITTSAAPPPANMITMIAIPPPNPPCRHHHHHHHQVQHHHQQHHRHDHHHHHRHDSSSTDVSLQGSESQPKTSSFIRSGASETDEQGLRL